MFLSDRDIKYAIETKVLIVNPPPGDDGYDHNSIDLHLGDVENAMVWDMEAYGSMYGVGRKYKQDDGWILELGDFKYTDFAAGCLVPVSTREKNPNVYRNGDTVYVKPSGFLLWTTREVVGTPEENPELVSFVNAKSTKARTGIMVHFTAPTINSGWEGNITLEIINLGPFTFALRPGDAIAQLTVAKITSRPDVKLRPEKKKSETHKQTTPAGRPAEKKTPSTRKK